MKNSFIRIVKWFCRQLTFNELASAVVIFHEVLSNSRDDISLKPNPKPPHYRRFRVDTLPPILKSDYESEEKKLSWVELKKEIELKTGKELFPVKRTHGKSPPVGCVCGTCGAPQKYLYLNNGKMDSQVKCKICGKTSPTHNIKLRNART